MEPRKKVKNKKPIKIKVKKDKDANKVKPVKCTVTKITKVMVVTNLKNKFQIEGYGWRDMVWAFSLGIIVGVIISKV